MATPNNAHMRLVTHTARMLKVLAAREDHPRAAEYATQITIYRGEWAKLNGPQRAEATNAVRTATNENDERLVQDLTDDEIIAAIAALEG
jgi:hypothetical protein